MGCGNSKNQAVEQTGKLNSGSVEKRQVAQQSSNNANPPQLKGLKLYYFDIYGRAESIRFLLSHGKINYENVNVGNDNILNKLKDSNHLEFGQVPMLETAEGKRYVQSWAILRYLGRILGYYPNDNLLAWKIDSTIDAAEDYFSAYFKFNFESNEEKKQIYKEAFL